MRRIDFILASAIVLSALGLLTGGCLLLALAIGPGRFGLGNRIRDVAFFCFAAGLFLAATSVLRNRFLRRKNLFEGGNAFGLLAALTSLIGLAWLIQLEGRGFGISAANYCINNERKIEAAKENWALRTGVTNGAEVSWSDIAPEFPGGFPNCPDGGKYTLGRVGEEVSCSNPEHRTKGILKVSETGRSSKQK